MHVYSHLPRMRNVVIPVLFAVTTVMLIAGNAHAADIDPAGIGDLMPSPDSKVPQGEGTLYETYGNPNLWQLDSDFGEWDFLDPMAEFVADVGMGIIAALGQACVVIVQWIFQLTTIPALENAITNSIGGAAKGLTATLLPSALAVGGLIAFVQHRKGGGGGGLSQISWVLVSGVVSMSLLTSPQVWVAGLDSVRQIGATITMNATAEGLGDGTQDYPFKMDHDPKFTENNRDNMLRKSSDAVWRAYVASPWCVANFGSFEVCEKYGADLLDIGVDKQERKEWLQETVTTEAVGDGSVTWRQGHSPVGRIMVVLPSLASILLFAALILMLAFTSLASLLGALMLLLTGVIFACLWVIPGRPREWGFAWFDQLLARALESTIATMTLGAVLTLQTATTTMFGQYGWLPSAGLSIAVAVVGANFRAVVAQIFGVRGTTNGMMAAALLTRGRGSNSGTRRRRGGFGIPQPPITLPRRRRRPPTPPGPGPGGPGGPDNPALPPGGGGDDPTITVTRVPRPRPPLPRPLPGPAGGGPTPGPGGPTLPPGRPSPALPPGRTGSPRPDAPLITVTRDGQPGATSPLPPHTRPALPPAPTGTPTPHRPTGGGSPSMRPDGDPNYAFRQAPAAGPDGGIRVIPATVIRSTPNGPPPRPARTAPPARVTAPTRREPPATPRRNPTTNRG